MTNVPEDRIGEEIRDAIKIDGEAVRGHLDELVRATVEETLNQMLDAEADQLCRAKRYERSPDRVDSRAGSYSRKLQTKAGEVKLKVPRLRSLPFETQIIERYKRRESSVEEALVEMYLAGVSVRRVEDITEALWGTRVSSSTVSELNQKIYERIEAWRSRPLEGEHPYVMLDGIWLKRSWGGEVKNVAVLVAVGVRTDGHREILGVAEGTKEDSESWRTFLRHLKERGLKGVRLIVSDKCLGLVEALGEFFPEAAWQRCTVQLLPQRAKGRSSRQVKRRGGDAQGGARPGRPGRGAREGGTRHGEAQFASLGCCRQMLPRGRGRDAGLHELPARALDTDPQQQHAGADHERDSAANPGGGRVPGRPKRPDAGGGPAAPHRRHEMGDAALPGHGPAG